MVSWSPPDNNIMVILLHMVIICRSDDDDGNGGGEDRQHIDLRLASPQVNRQRKSSKVKGARRQGIS